MPPKAIDRRLGEDYDSVNLEFGVPDSVERGIADEDWNIQKCVEYRPRSPEIEINWCKDELLGGPLCLVVVVGKAARRVSICKGSAQQKITIGQSALTRGADL